LRFTMKKASPIFTMKSGATLRQRSKFNRADAARFEHEPETASACERSYS
jgi:hypothetical protein